MMFPAGREAESGRALFVVRVDRLQSGGAVAGYEDGCAEVGYALVVAEDGVIVRTQRLVYAGETCMHWRDEQVTVGPSLFVWRDPGHGAPPGPDFDMQAWQRRQHTIELPSLRVDGRIPRRIDPDVALLGVEP